MEISRGRGVAKAKILKGRWSKTGNPSAVWSLHSKENFNVKVLFLDGIEMLISMHCSFALLDKVRSVGFNPKSFIPKKSPWIAN